MSVSMGPLCVCVLQHWSISSNDTQSMECNHSTHLHEIKSINNNSIQYNIQLANELSPHQSLLTPFHSVARENDSSTINMKSPPALQHGVFYSPHSPRTHKISRTPSTFFQCSMILTILVASIKMTHFEPHLLL